MGAVIFVILYTASLFIPLISPFTRYPLFVLKCLNLPIEASEFMAGDSYTVPGSQTYRVDMFTTHYFCTESQAQAAGFHKYGF